VSGSTYTVSFLVKKTGAHTIAGYYCPIGGGAAGNLGGGFDVSGSFSSGSIYNTAGTTNRIRRVEQWGTDVYRCSETFTMTASGTIGNFFFAPVTSTTNNNGPAVGEQIAFAAPQFELGSVPTTFIPTTAAAVTRNADVITLSGAVSGCIGQTEGTMYWEGNALINGAQDIFFLNRATTNAVTIYKNSQNYLRLEVFANSASAVQITNTVAVTGFLKLAAAYKSGDTTFYINGQKIGSTNTNAITFTGALNSIVFAHAPLLTNGGGNQQCRAAAVYTTRLTDSELAALTTL
jgi:hypothetical protein